VGDLQFKSADVGPLDEVLKMGDSMTDSSKPTRLLLDAARLVHSLRKAVRAKDWHKMKVLLDQAGDMIMPESAMPELTRIQDEVDNRNLIHQITEALSRGAPSGFVGAMDATSIDTALLEARLAHWKEVGWKTEIAKDLVRVGTLFLILRRAMQAGDEEAADDAL